MDFLDPAKQRQHTIMVLVGYVLIAIGILMAAVILVYYAYGYSYGKNGQVIRNGLMFVSSEPHPATVYLDGKLYRDTTNTRIILPEGQYSMRLARTGYRDWNRDVTIDGGKVVHYDYPLLIPTELHSEKVKDFTEVPTLSVQSPDKRWLLVGQKDIDRFELVDFKDPKKIKTTAVQLPAGVLSATKTAQSWQLVNWSNDNRHVLLKHVYDSTYEYILVDRQAPEQTVNLSRTLGVSAVNIDLIDKRYDRYFVFDQAKQTLSKASLAEPQPAVYLDHVLAYKSYGTDTVAYAASAGPDSDGSVKLRLYDGKTSYVLRKMSSGTTYLVDLTRYDDKLYVAGSAASEDKAYVYRDPIAEINDPDVGVAVPDRVLRITKPNFMDFSANSRFLLVESGNKFAINDAEDDKGYTYSVPGELDAPQTHATWIDGHHLMYVSDGTVQLFDYDNKNPQALVASQPQFVPVFDGSTTYLFTYTHEAQDTAKWSLIRTPLRIPDDL
jgi:hypothetical protein